MARFLMTLLGSSKKTDWHIFTTDLYKVPDAVLPIHTVSSHVATDKDPSK